MPLLDARPAYKPFTYPWAYDAWLMQQRIHWLPEEVPLADDVKDWQRNLSAAERNLLTQIFRFFTQADVEVQKKEGFERFIRREPLGVVLVVAPWNYPWLTSVNALVPALLAGNSVILKMAAQTPRVAERYADAFAAAGLPEGVFQYLHMDHGETARVIADALTSAGFEVIVGLDRNEPTVPLERTEYVRSDESYSILDRIVKAARIDTIVHTFLVVDSTQVSSRTIHEINVIGTMNLFAAASAPRSSVRPASANDCSSRLRPSRS